MNKRGEINIFEVILMVIIVGLLVAYVFDWISFGGTDITVPEEKDIPTSSETQTNETINEVSEFQKCTTPSVGSWTTEEQLYRVYSKSEECNWDHTKYYNRNCTEGWWRCMESPRVGEYLCSYACPNNKYCGDGIVGGGETEWDCIDANPKIGFIGTLTIG